MDLPSARALAAKAGSVGSRFVSQNSLDEARARREADYKAAYQRLGQEPPPREAADDDYDGRSLFERLQEHKDRKQTEFEEMTRFSNQWRGLDEEESKFLDDVMREKMEGERKKKERDLAELQEFRKAQAAQERPSTDPIELLSGAGRTSPPSTWASISPNNSRPSAASTFPSSSKQQNLPLPGSGSATAPPKKKKKGNKDRLAMLGVVKKVPATVTGPAKATVAAKAKAEEAPTASSNKRPKPEPESEGKKANSAKNAKDDEVGKSSHPSGSKDNRTTEATSASQKDTTAKRRKVEDGG